MTGHPRISRLARRPLAMALALLGPAAVNAAAIDPIGPEPGPAPIDPQITFNPDLVHSTGGVDLSRFERGNVTLAGIYRPSVLVNGEPIPGCVRSRSVRSRTAPARSPVSIVRCW